MLHAIGIRHRARGLALRREAALALREMAKHDAVAILLEIGIAEAQRVAELVEHGGEQINAPSGGAGGIGVAARRRDDGAEERVALRARVHMPAVPAGVVVHADAVAVRLAQIPSRQIGDFKRDAAQPRGLLLRQSRRLPARERRGDDAIELRLREHGGSGGDFGLRRLDAALDCGECSRRNASGADLALHAGELACVESESVRSLQRNVPLCNCLAFFNSARCLARGFCRCRLRDY